MTAVRPVSVCRVPAGPWAQNCYVVAAAGDAVVIDPGGEAERIVERIESQRLRVRAVLATHGHHDHVGALGQIAELYDVPFGIHSDDERVLRQVNFHRFVFHKLEPVALPPIEIDLAGSTALRFGELDVVVVQTPGHSPGSVCFEIGGELFTGDTLMATHAGHTDLPGGDRETLAASLAMLRERYPPTIRLRPGHGEAGTLGGAVADMAAVPGSSP